MTDNLGLGRIASALAAGQWAKSDDIDGGLDAALTEGPLQVSFVGGSPTNSATLTVAQFIGNAAFQCVAGSPGPSGACTLNVPALNAQAATLKRGNFNVFNDLAVSVTVQKSGGQSETAPTLSAGQRSVLYFDGSNVYIAVPQGVVGADGVSPGIKYLFDSSTTTTADPGSGDLRLNNAALASVTEIALSDFSAEAGNPSVEGDLASWDDSSSATKGRILIKKRGAPQNSATYEITGSVNAAGWWRFTVNHKASAGSFSAADSLDVLFVPKGDQGAGSTVTVEEENVSVVAAASIINFKGDHFNVADAGGGQADVSLAGYKLAGTWDHGVSGDSAAANFIGLAGCAEILLLARSVTKSITGLLNVNVSVDNGGSYYSTSGNYRHIFGDGTETDAGAIANMHHTNATAARSGHARVLGCNITGLKIGIGAAGSLEEFRFFVASTSPINAVRVVSSGGGNLTGGQIYCLIRT